MVPCCHATVKCAIKGLPSLLVLVCLAGTALAQTPRNSWPLAGQNLSNTRSQASERVLSADNVHRLVRKWVFRTGGSVSATPSVDEHAVYVPDWSGKIFAIDRDTGQEIWSRDVSDITGGGPDLARTTPAIAGSHLVLGNQAGTFGRGAHVFVLDKRTGETLWVTQVDEHPFAVITQSPVVHGGRVYFGVSSLEEIFAGVLPNYECCTFRGSVLALDLVTGRIRWKTYTVPEGEGFSGNSVWGSTPVVDVSRGSLYVTTGNNYTVPVELASCVAAARRRNAADTTAVQRCVEASPGNYFDAVIALDLDTGEVKWSRSALPFDAWTVSCVLELINGDNCPSPSGPDHDFGQGPALVRLDLEAGAGRRELLGAGQKSGVYWALDPETGEVVWKTTVGPGGLLGGMMWGSAVDGERIYVANANYPREPWTLVRPPSPFPASTRGGFWTALDPRSGEILWQTAEPNRRKTEGAVTVANGVVFGGSMARRPNQRTMFAMNAETGRILWSFASGATVVSAPAVVDGMVFWGSGYPVVKGNGGTTNDKLYAFELGDP